MTVIIPDNKIRNVKLTGDEIGSIIDDLERLPKNYYDFMNYNEIIKKLNDALRKNDEVNK